MASNRKVYNKEDQIWQEESMEAAKAAIKPEDL